jgi:zinc protease
MRPTIRTAALLGALLLSSPALLAQARNWREIPTPPLRQFTIQQPTRVTLPNGMIILLQPDRELPLISGRAMVRGGSRDVPAEKAGLVSIYGDVWRTGGTASRTGDQLDDFLEARAARIETGGGIDSTSISFNVLKEDFAPVFDIFVDLLRNPAFREEKISLSKTQLRTGIARRNDDPMGIAAREATKIAYGIDSPYARTAEYYTVEAVNREDLVQWHKRHVHPNNIILGITGDFDPKTMEQRLRKAFASWQKGPEVAAPKIDFTPPAPAVYVVNKDDVNQSSIRLITLGVRRDNPDYFALDVLNEVLSGGFASRLFSNVRSKKGLAYAVGGGVGSQFDRPGTFILQVGTKSETTGAAIEALQEELTNIVQSPPTQEELNRAREAILNSYVFRFDSKTKLLNEQMVLTFYGYPLDFYSRYRDAVEKVTVEDLRRVAQKYVNRDNMAILVVGREADFEKPLSTFGPVQTIDITIPDAPPGQAKAAPAAGDQAGRAVANRVLTALGGKAKVDAVKSVRQRAKVMMKTPQGEIPITMDAVHVYPDRMYQVLATPMGEMTIVASPQAAFMRGPMGAQDLPGSQRDEQLAEIRRAPFFILQHMDDPDVTFTAAGSERIGEVEAQIVDVNVKGAQVRWYVDPATGRILRSSNRAMTPQGPATQVTDFSDWREVSGVPMAFRRVITVNGEEGGSATAEEIVINPQVDESMFVKP